MRAAALNAMLQLLVIYRCIKLNDKIPDKWDIVKWCGKIIK